MTRRGFLSLLAFFAASAPRLARAHHSTAMFDQAAWESATTRRSG